MYRNQLSPVEYVEVGIVQWAMGRLAANLFQLILSCVPSADPSDVGGRLRNPHKGQGRHLPRLLQPGERLYLLQVV